MNRRKTKIYNFIVNRLVNPDDKYRMNESGVYRMFHISRPESFYVGASSFKRPDSKTSQGCYGRWVNHLSCLRNNKHHSVALQDTITFRGMDGIRFEILVICKDEDVRRLEREYYDKMNHDLNGIENLMGIPVYQFDLTGNFIKKHRSMVDASNETGLDRGVINHIAIGNRVSTGGYIFSYTKDGLKLPKRRYIHKLTIDGRLIKTYKSLAEITTELGIISSTSIRGVLSGTQKTAYGYKWEETEHSKEAIEQGYSLPRNQKL